MNTISLFFSLFTLKSPYTFQLSGVQPVHATKLKVYGSKLLSCRLTAKVVGELRQCLFQATSGVKDQRHRNFVTSHSTILPSKLSLLGAAMRMSKRS